MCITTGTQGQLLVEKYIGNIPEPEQYLRIRTICEATRSRGHPGHLAWHELPLGSQAKAFGAHIPVKDVIGSADKTTLPYHSTECA